ncbi:MAG: serine/threonine protein kinase, partial [Deltaproteobacteria bacterium]|nr:serine/threonine protein kinase [Nannocystaceae bacterium]
MTDDNWRARVGPSIGGWKLGPQVGKGGMGIVVKCSKMVDGHLTLGLMKLPFATSVGEEWALRRHHAEVEVMTVVKGCINVVQILEHGVDGGIHFYVMEYVHGADLFKFSRALWRNDARFQPAMVAWLLGELLYGLADVHDLVEAGKPKGIIHKDIKPPNILISTKGALKIGDFGIATTGAMLGLSLRGTKQYMAPEHYHGYPQARSDVWGAMATAWELLAGRPLRNGENEEQIARQVGQPAPGPPCGDLSDAFVQLFQDGLALLPEQRFGAKEGAARVEALPEYKMMRTKVGALLCENVRRLDGSGRTDMLGEQVLKMSKDVAGLFAAERVYMEGEDDEGNRRPLVVVRGEPQLPGPATMSDGPRPVPDAPRPVPDEQPA